MPKPFPIEFVDDPDYPQDPKLKPFPVYATNEAPAPAPEVPTFSEIDGTVPDATGTNLQEILNDIASRLAALEP